MKNSVNLSQYSNMEYKKKSEGFFKTVFWYFTNIFFFKNPFVVSSRLKVFILKMFGAKVGNNVIIKPIVNIKYPWFLEIGSNVWIGEEVWIDNLTKVVIENNVCLSQGAMLLTGNHNYKKKEFDLILGEIVLKEGCWIGAKSVVCPGVTVGSHAILSVGSVTSSNLNPYTIYKSHECKTIRQRVIQ